MQMTAKKRGRKSKPYPASNGEHIDGLYRRPGTNQWRVLSTGFEFRENDEFVAIARFRQLTASSPFVMVTAPLRDALPIKRITNDQSPDFKFHDDAAKAAWTATQAVEAVGAPDVTIKFDVNTLPEEWQMQAKTFGPLLWPWLRTMLLHKPEVVAQHVAIPQLATLSQWDLPKDSITLNSLIKAYEDHSKATKIVKRKVRQAWDEMTTVTGAKTLRDLTTELLVTYSDHVNAQQNHGPVYKACKFGRVKHVISHGKKRGFNAAEIRGALDRCDVLARPTQPPKADPKPISKADFHKLMEKADTLHKAILLVSLNCCMYCSEALSFEWEEIDFENSVYLSRREKTGITRAAVLWPRTLAALKALRKIDNATGCSLQVKTWSRVPSEQLSENLQRVASVCQVGSRRSQPNTRRCLYGCLHTRRRSSPCESARRSCRGRRNRSIRSQVS